MRNVVTPISVVLPVGPKESHTQWLYQAVLSIAAQNVPPDQVVIVDDGGRHNYGEVLDPLRGRGGPRRIDILEHHWPLGVVAAMNNGIGFAYHDLVLMMCADDKLLENCVEECWKAWEREQEPLGYYYLGVKYSGGQEQNTACGAAMITKQLWQYTGGFPPACAVGAADHIFLSALIAGSRDGYSKAKIIRVSDQLTYWYRQHDDTETSRNIWPAIEAVRDSFTANWRPCV